MSKWGHLIEGSDAEIQRLLHQAQAQHLDDNGMARLVRLVERAGKALWFTKYSRIHYPFDAISDVTHSIPRSEWVGSHIHGYKAPIGRLFFMWMGLWYTLDEIYSWMLEEKFSLHIGGRDETSPTQ